MLVEGGGRREGWRRWDEAFREARLGRIQAQEPLRVFLHHDPYLVGGEVPFQEHRDVDPGALVVRGVMDISPCLVGVGFGLFLGVFWGFGVVFCLLWGVVWYCIVTVWLLVCLGGGCDWGWGFFRVCFGVWGCFRGLECCSRLGRRVA